MSRQPKTPKTTPAAPEIESEVVVVADPFAHLPEKVRAEMAAGREAIAKRQIR